WNAGRIVSSGFLVTLTGYLFDKKLAGAKEAAAIQGAWQYSWMVVMGLLAALMALLGTWHLKFLPGDQRSSNAPKGFEEGVKEFVVIWIDLFKKPGILLSMAFILLYRSGEGFIEKIAPLFMLDPVSKGGLGLSNQVLGNINGTFGSLGFMFGTLL